MLLRCHLSEHECIYAFQEIKRKEKIGSNSVTCNENNKGPSLILFSSFDRTHLSFLLKVFSFPLIVPLAFLSIQVKVYIYWLDHRFVYSFSIVTSQGDTNPLAFPCTNMNTHTKNQNQKKGHTYRIPQKKN